jgi:hypothetical protein
LGSSTTIGPAIFATFSAKLEGFAPSSVSTVLPSWKEKGRRY